MMPEISNEKWIEIGTKFCNLKNDYRKKFYYKQELLKKTKAYKFYNHFHNDFICLAGRFDTLIQKYYPNDIITINGINITNVFYCLGDDYDYRHIPIEDAKSNIVLLEEYENFMNYMVDTLQDAFRYNIDYKEVLIYDKILHKKLTKRIQNGYID